MLNTIYVYSNLMEVMRISNAVKSERGSGLQRKTQSVNSKVKGGRCRLRELVLIKILLRI